MSGFTLDWRGKAVLSRMQEATRRGIDATCAAAVTPAKQRVRRRTGLLQGSIQFRPAKRVGGRTVGSFGSYDVSYALWQEIGTGRMSAQPYLRPAADAEFPKLHSRIGGFFRGGP
jgi:hypothetical protein